MKNKTLTALALSVIFLLTACGTNNVKPTVESVTAAPIIPTETVTLTSTPDPCSQENITVEIQAVHRLMREFDDASALSANTPREELKPTIADLQRIRRAAEDKSVPSCLSSLKELQLAHMNTFIQTLLAFIGGADQEVVNQGIGLSRQLHDQYMIEMAHMQGVTIPLKPQPSAHPWDARRHPKC